MDAWSNRRKAATVATAFFVMITIACFWTVISEVIAGKALQRDGSKAYGIVAFARNAGATLVIGFSLPDGRRVQFEEYLLHSGYQVGAPVPVRYDQSNPASTARVDGPGIAAPNMVFVFFGMASFVLTFMALAQAVTDSDMGFRFRR